MIFKIALNNMIPQELCNANCKIACKQREICAIKNSISVRTHLSGFCRKCNNLHNVLKHDGKSAARRCPVPVESV